MMPDEHQRWQYGVMFADRSISWRWSGASSRNRALEVIARWPGETHLVRRPVDGHGHIVGEPEETE